MKREKSTPARYQVVDRHLGNILPYRHMSLRIMRAKLPIPVKRLEKMDFLAAPDSTLRQN